MFIEMHILQNFAPSNLNRDDTGSPKDCEFGGYRRARISSQCLKRAMREKMRCDGLLDAAQLGSRTKRLVEEVAKRLITAGRPEEGARAIVAAALQSVGLKVVEADKTQYLLFLGQSEVAAVAEVCNTHWDALAAVVAGSAEGKAGTGKGKKEAKAAVPEVVGKELKKRLDGGRAADLALFGRMLADLPDHNIDAASQVAHAISTHKVTMEFDFYTAVDDLKPDDTSGADMLGTIEFNSACYYRYLNVDAAGLCENLDGDEDLARATLRAYLNAAIHAMPSGKQNSMAALSMPSLVFIVAREAGLWSLANAFATPVAPSADGLVNRSVAALDRYWGQLTRMYGRRGILGTWACALDGAAALESLARDNAVVENIDQAIDGALGTVRFGVQGSAA